jgi:hypothetical protein
MLGSISVRFPAGGWSIWVRDADSDRHFIVAISKAADALKEVFLVVPDAQLLSSEALTQDVLRELGLRPGRTVERESRPDASASVTGRAGHLPCASQ